MSYHSLSLIIPHRKHVLSSVGIALDRGKFYPAALALIARDGNVEAYSKTEGFLWEGNFPVTEQFVVDDIQEETTW